MSWRECDAHPSAHARGTRRETARPAESSPSAVAEQQGEPVGQIRGDEAHLFTPGLGMEPDWTPLRERDRPPASKAVIAPASTSPVPAVASAGPLLATTRPAVGVGHDRRRSLVDDDSADRGCEFPAGGDGVGGGVAGEPGELTAVRVNTVGAARIANHIEELGLQCVAVENERTVDAEHRGHIDVMAGAESGTHEYGSHTIKVGDRCGTPRRGGSEYSNRLDRIVDAVAARDRHLHVAAPRRWAERAARRGAPVIVDDPPMMRMAWCHLWTVAAGTGSQSATSDPFDEVNRGVARVEADVGDHHLAGQFVPWFEKTGLQRRKSDRAIGSGRRTEARSGETVDPGRDVDGEDGDTLGNGREVVGPTEARAVGSIDDEIDLDRQRGDVGIEQRIARHDAGAGWRRAAVGPVVALACDDRHPPSIRPAQKVDGGASHRCASTFDERSDRHGAAASIAAISAGVTIGITRAAPPRPPAQACRYG